MRTVLSYLLIALVGCAAMAHAQSAADLRAAEAAMLEADRGFNQAVADHDLERFMSFVAEDASFESAETRGRDAVAKAWAPFFAPNGPTISWTPSKAEALVGADVGYTRGRWQQTRVVDGKPVRSEGEYLTVWRKQKDGSWKAIFDSGSTKR